MKERAASGLRPKDIMPPTLVDQGTADGFWGACEPELLDATAAECKLNFKLRYHEGYGHAFNFI